MRYIFPTITSWTARQVFRLLGALLVIPSLATADLADEDPEELCGLLDSFGLVMTAYVPPSAGERPLCYVLNQPYSAFTDGFQYSYRVIAHHERDHPKALFLEVEGSGAKILGQEPHDLFMKMSKVFLTKLFTDDVVANTVLAIQSVGPGFNRHMTVEGLNLQLSTFDNVSSSVHGSIRIRIDINNICEYDPSDVARKSRCLLKWHSAKGSLLADGVNTKSE